MMAATASATHDHARPLRIGDRVRFAECFMPLCGVIVDELSELFVLVKWDDVAEPMAHWRSSLIAED